MDICDTKDALRLAMAQLRRTGSIGLVPTMGYLHDGHMELVRRAKAENDHVVASIFVNPTQFGSAEDLEKYPRDMDRDLAMLRDLGVAAVFTPTPDVMYHPDAETIVETTELAHKLMGALRPGHFRGVATVVTKLFNLFQPDRAYFGEKDYQQLAVIRTMVRDLDIPVDIRGIPTVREPDGLAMSSRNARLSPQSRAAAPILAQSFDLARRLIYQGLDASSVKNAVWEMIASEPLAHVETVDIQDAVTLENCSGPIENDIVILLAVTFDPVLLIDQCVIPFEKEKV
jgi:pantoate--beta-alanine ligase